MKIIAVRFSSLGDIVLAMLATDQWILRHLKCPLTSRIDLYFILDPSFHAFAESLHRSMIEQLPTRSAVVWHFITLKKKPWYYFLKQLRVFAKKQQDVDIILDWHQDWRSWLISIFLAQAIVISPARRTFERWWLRHIHRNIYDWDAPEMISRSLLQRWIQDTDFSMSLIQSSMAPSNLVKTTVLTSAASKILFFPGAAHRLKQWPMSYWLLLAKMMDESLPLHYSLHWVWGPQDVGLDELTSFRSLTSRSVFFNPGDLSLDLLPELINQAFLVICNDSFPAHVAKALKRPSAVFYGPTHESFGFAYIEDPQYLLLSMGDLSCRPCSSTGKGVCRFTEQHCLVDLKPAIVWEKIREKFFHE